MIWRAAPRCSTVSALLRSRATSLGLVAALGFLLLVSLVVSGPQTQYLLARDDVVFPGSCLGPLVKFYSDLTLCTSLSIASQPFWATPIRAVDPSVVRVAV